MTDSRPTPLSDEDLSSLLDGEAPPEVAARLQADPVAQARLAELRAAVAALRSTRVAPLDAGTIDHLVERAISAGTAEAAPDTGPTPPTPLERPVTSARRIPPFLVAAAVVAMVAIGLGLVWSGQQGGDDTATRFEPVGAPLDPSRARSDDPGSSEGGAGDTAEEAPAAESEAPDSEHGQAPIMGAVPDPADFPGRAEIAVLGDHATLADLRTALATGFPADAELTDPGAADTPSNLSVERCKRAVATLLPVTGQPTEVGLASVDGSSLLVYEFALAEPTDGADTLVTFADTDTCGIELAFQR